MKAAAAVTESRQDVFQLSEEEVRAVEKLGTALDSFEGPLSDTKGLYRRLKNEAALAQDVYIRTSSPEDYQTYRRLVDERDRAFAIDRTGEKRRVARAALARFILRSFCPVVTPIVDRALDLASRTAARVEQEDNARHLEIFGVPVTNSLRLTAARSAQGMAQGLRRFIPVVSDLTQARHFLTRLKSL